MDSVSLNRSNSTGFFIAETPLSAETRKKLRELGIDPSTVTSEAHAQMLIRAAEAKKIQNHTTQSSSKSATSSEYQLISKAKQIAKKMGIKDTDNKTLSELIETVTDKISLMAKIYGENSQKINDINATKKYIEEIKDEYTKISKNQDSMYAGLNLIAEMNKYSLGINQ